MRYIPYIKKSVKLFYKNKIMPEYVTFFVTNKCNAKCNHCFYWKNLNTHLDELGLDEIEKISRSMGNFLFLILTGGEPFIRKDLADIAKIFYINNNVRKMNIMTNGILTNRILNTIKNINIKCPELYVTLFISIDDIGENHDRIRGIKGTYKNVLKTMSHLKKIQATYSKLSLGITITYSSFNEDRIIEIYNHIKTNIKPDTINCSFIRGDAKNKIAKKCSIDNFVKIQEILKKDLIHKKLKGVYDPLVRNIVVASKFESTSQLIRIVKKDKYLFPCYAGKINATIYPNGGVFPCELLNDKMGNLRENNYDFKKVWFSKKSDQIRKKIKESKCYCTHECNLLPNTIYNPRFSFKIIKNYLRLLFRV